MLHKVVLIDMRGDLMVPLMYQSVAVHNDKVIQCRFILLMIYTPEIRYYFSLNAHKRLERGRNLSIEINQVTLRDL